VIAEQKKRGALRVCCATSTLFFAARKCCSRAARGAKNQHDGGIRAARGGGGDIMNRKTLRSWYGAGVISRGGRGTQTAHGAISALFISFAPHLRRAATPRSQHGGGAFSAAPGKHLLASCTRATRGRVTLRNARAARHRKTS